MPMNTDETHLNAPHAKLAHLGCAGLILLAGLSGTMSLLHPDFHLWLLAHHYTMPLLVLGLLAAAYLLEHALTTAAMLALLVAAALYFTLTFPTSKIIAYFERRMRRGDVR